MARIDTEITIHASAERVWGVLTDFAAYPDWNPFLTQIDGEAREGAKLSVRITPDGGRTMNISPTVLRADPNNEFRWRGRLLMPGIFTGEHSFRIEATDEGPVRFVQSERFTGVLVPLVLALVGKSTRRGFEAMNQALKQRAEQPEPA